jgi:hypothetical protein
MREIVTNCRRSYFNYQFISKSDHVGACDFRALLVGYVVVLDRAQYLRLRTTDLFDRFIRVAVDNNG